MGKTRLRDHGVDDDEAAVCRGLVETPFDIETSGFTYISTLASWQRETIRECCDDDGKDPYINVDSFSCTNLHQAFGVNARTGVFAGASATL